MAQDSTTIGAGEFEKSRNERILHSRISAFFERWSPEDRRDASEMHADFHDVVRLIYVDAQRPLQKALTDALTVASHPLFITQLEAMKP